MGQFNERQEGDRWNIEGKRGRFDLSEGADRGRQAAFGNRPQLSAGASVGGPPLCGAGP